MNSRIPENIRSLALCQCGEVFRTDKSRAIAELDRLGIRRGSELYEFFCEFQVSAFSSTTSYEELSDICEPSSQISLGTRFVHEVWELPSEYVCLTSCEGEGCYLYSNKSEAVYDFSLETRDAFLREPTPKWLGFYAFMEWYLQGSPPSC